MITFSIPSPATQRKTRLDEKIEMLIQHFGSYLQYFDKNSLFNKAAQLNSHMKTIRRRRELGSAALAAADSIFCESLHATLHNWGRNGRFPGLKPYGAFFKAITAKAPELAMLDKYLIDDPALDVPKVAAEVWNLIESLDIVTSESKIVSGTKAMHHLLPDLVVPMDHGYTQPFFERQNPDFQYRGGLVFQKICVECARIACSVPVNSYVEMRKRTAHGVPAGQRSLTTQ
jgi:hypothetical protein